MVVSSTEKYDDYQRVIEKKIIAIYTRVDGYYFLDSTADVIENYSGYYPFGSIFEARTD